MKSRTLATLTAAILAVFLSTAARAATSDAEDSDTRFTDAKVVEVTEQRISIIARSGVEHVIALDSVGTRVTLAGSDVRTADLKVGDIVTVVLDAESQLKLARQITVGAPAGGFARLARVRE
ncbi:MAG TPA: hypothetical protein VEY09_18495 [Pyrinomonadaceae bacterium]|nr:hypothetical protein [Pyrinomonadaceae bacterium]